MSVGLPTTRPTTAGRPPRPTRRRLGGAESNTRLTASVAALLLVLLAAEGFTVVRVGRLLTVHVFIGMLLVPPVLVKMASTLWRFGQYYRGSPDYRRKGPPPPLLRILGPVVIVTTSVVFATGIALLLGPPSIRTEMLRLHQVSFVLWFAVMTVHVLGHVGETARVAPLDWMRRTRRQVDGAGARQWVLALSLVVGLVLAIAVVPQVGPWLHGGRHAVESLRR
ncbi:MAG: hypothetical protein ABSF84_01420 [Acidimicrobiales bacterium]